MGSRIRHSSMFSSSRILLLHFLLLLLLFRAPFFYNNFINYLTALHMRANFSFGNLHIVRDLSLSLPLFLGDLHIILYTIPSACGPGCSFSRCATGPCGDDAGISLLSFPFRSTFGSTFRRRRRPLFRKRSSISSHYTPLLCGSSYFVRPTFRSYIFLNK